MCPGTCTTSVSGIWSACSMLAGLKVIRRKHFSCAINPAGLATSWRQDGSMARRISRRLESPRQQLFKDLVYLAMVVAAMPLTMIEAACHAGSTIMMEARKKP